MKFKVFFLLFLTGILTNAPLKASVTLPKLISDGMVLQRDVNVKIWGWASPSEKISVAINNRNYNTTADTKGDWAVSLDKFKAGGPYSITIQGENSITIHNILFGDVWICSGQSNMELPMRRVTPLYASEIANATNTNIRCFTVPQQYDFKEARKDFSGGTWQSANPVSVLNFSAAAYFFAKEIHQKYNIPVGIIVTALGGSPAEAWVSEDMLKKYPHYYQEMQKWKNDNLIRQTEQSEQSKIKAWYDELRRKDEGFANPQQTWLSPSYNASGWASMQVPGYWQNTPLDKISGVVWFRKEISIPAAMVGQPASLNLGRIVDADSVFVNEKFVGTTAYQYPPRWYQIPAGILHEGKNTLIVRIIVNSGQGGFVPDKPYTLSAGSASIALQGEWQYKAGAVLPPTPSQTFIRWKPGGLYNGMLAPLFNYQIKGAVWYQGEANTDRAKEYQWLLADLIADWRTHWHQGYFPFVIAQLPNFMEPKENPSESNWAQLRFSQFKTLAVPNTAIAVAIDLGEWNDIHPLKKQDVGYRLALAAEKIAYKANIVYSGPLYRSKSVEGNKIIVTFTNCGSGLTVKDGGKLKEFAIAGADGKYVWANATIDKDKVVVWNDTVAHPVSVRYAWADNPAKANLYNKEGLPASPFEAP